jgi:hypothetical protein
MNGLNKYIEKLTYYNGGNDEKCFSKDTQEQK